MLDLNIRLTDLDVEFLNASKNNKSFLKRIKKITGLYAGNIFQYIEKECETSELIRCGFCGSIRIFAFDYIINNNKLYIDNISYSKEINICSRKDNEITKTCRSKKLNPNSIEFVKIAYNFITDEEANSFILKRNKSPFYRTNYETDEEYHNAQRRDKNFYGSEKKYNDVLKKIGESNKKENLIIKYGKLKAEEICKSKDSSSKEHFKEKYGENWEYFFEIKSSKTNGSIKRFIETYGEIIGEIKYNQFVEKARKNSINFFNSLTPDERSKLFGTSSKKYFKEKYGENWERFYKDHQLKIQSSAQIASNESLIFFNLLIERISHLNLKYYIGVEGNKEWFIYDSENKKMNFYDFCIKELNLIIEYHGSLWHFNPNFKYKGNLPFGMTLESNKQKDEYKQSLAESTGFEYYVVFDTDDFNLKVEELSKIIINKTLM